MSKFQIIPKRLAMSYRDIELDYYTNLSELLKYHHSYGKDNNSPCTISRRRC